MCNDYEQHVRWAEYRKVMQALDLATYRSAGPGDCGPRTVGSATAADFYGADEAACFGGDRRRGRRWWDRSDPAPRRLVLVDPDGLAPAARQRCSWCADAGQAGTQVGSTQPFGSGTGAGQAGECTARAAIGARRGNHRNPKKHSWTAVPPVDVETVSPIVLLLTCEKVLSWLCVHHPKTMLGLLARILPYRPSVKPPGRGTREETLARLRER